VLRRSWRTMPVLAGLHRSGALRVQGVQVALERVDSVVERYRRLATAAVMTQHPVGRRSDGPAAFVARASGGAAVPRAIQKPDLAGLTRNSAAISA